MAVREILKYPDPRLRTKAKRVREIDSSVQRLIDDLVDTMRAANGVGLAATQVGVPFRVAVVEPREGQLIVLINPEIVKTSGRRRVEEACLSIPGYWGELTRSEAVVVRALDRNGREFRLKATGLLAQALEHEIDHLNGILYIDRLDRPEDLHQVEAEPEEAAT
jgi:peptide deformylase